MEPETGLTILGGAIGGAKVVEKILGPTAEYLGYGLRDWTEKRVENVQRIFEKAHSKLGNAVDAPGSVPPRVLKEVLDEGSFCDNEIAAEYFGGVLASSRTAIGRDDRAASYLKVISELFSYQLRYHYICYYWFRELFKGFGLRPTFAEDLEKMHLFIGESFVIPAMEFIVGEDGANILMHCQSGLVRHDLIEITAWGKPEHMKPICDRNKWSEVSEWGLTSGPTQFGIDLWLWSVGLGSVSRTEYLSDGFQMPALPEIKFPIPPQKLVLDAKEK